jgi:alpha-ribazole phosphatase
MKIFFIRHGETNSNKQKKVMGQRVDESLNEEGRRQVQELTQKLKGTPYDMIFTSPLKRAVETSEIIMSDIPLTMLVRDELKERDFGLLSGKSWEEMRDEVGMEAMAIRQLDFDQKYDYRPYGGESAEDVHNRIRKFVSEVKEKYSDKKILVVAHGGILRAAELLFNERSTGHIANAAVIEFEI